MRNLLSQTRTMWLLAIGSFLGLAVGVFWPQAPLHAVSTDRQDNFAIATGMVDGGVEALFTLDFLTGELHGACVSPINPRTFTAMYGHNVTEDLKVEAGTAPKYLMITGMAPLRPAGQLQFGGSIVYVAELTTGNLAMYTVAFNPAWLTRPGSVPPQDFILLYTGPIRQASIRK